MEHGKQHLSEWHFCFQDWHIALHLFVFNFLGNFCLFSDLLSVFSGYFSANCKFDVKQQKKHKKINSQILTSKTYALMLRESQCAALLVVALITINAPEHDGSLAYLRHGKRTTVSCYWAGVRPRQTRQRPGGGARANGGATRSLVSPVEP